MKTLRLLQALQLILCAAAIIIGANCIAAGIWWIGVFDLGAVAFAAYMSSSSPAKR